ncbi:unnamed protein product [Phytophthora fragariaefolia]|uniref:Unnamed protein product n=1 Tax=Phytophthora fragariaefolia TaxID=1490495 RepID=A0A9W6XA64_9STRA|nr:unnamed protein product [Phytophthora fragariaefolia]
MLANSRGLNVIAEQTDLNWIISSGCQFTFYDQAPKSEDLTVMGLYKALILSIIISAIHLVHSEHTSADSKRAMIGRFLKGGTEERQFTVTKAVGTIATSIKRKGELKLYLSLGLSPEVVMKLLKVTSREDKNFRRYSKYFFRYYVKYLDAPTSHLPASTVENIMNERLYRWLADLLTPPQVFANLRLTGSWELARDQKNYKYFERYLAMYSKMQVRKSNGVEF